MWGTMVGKYLYPNGDAAPEIITDFLRQFARHYINHPGLGGYYLENGTSTRSGSNGRSAAPTTKATGGRSPTTWPGATKRSPD